MTSVSGGPSALPTAAAPAQRLAAVDLFRGIAIVAVVVHHLTGLSLRHVEAGSALYLGLAITNRALHFVVPAFLFTTAAVLTRSALRRFGPGAYYWARARTALLPYLLWTVLYVLFRVASGQDDPAVLTDPGRWGTWVQYGKGYFHLYFLLIALQFYLVLPLLLPLWRRRWPFWGVLLGALALQGVVYALNRGGALNFRFPATMAVWYVPSLTLGMYFGAQGGAFEELWDRWRGWVVAAAVLTLAWYLPVGVAEVEGQPISSLTYSAANWAYTTAAVLALFGVAHEVARRGGWWRPGLVYLGTVSLQVYLLHPAVLWIVEGWGFPVGTAAFALVLAGYGLAALALPVLVARLLAGTPVSRWLFGR